METVIRDEIARELGIAATELDDSLTFTDLGGHSLSALRLASTCKRMGLPLIVRDLLQNVPIKDITSRYTSIHDPNDSQPDSIDTDLSHTDISSITNLTPCLTPPCPLARCPIPEMQLSLIQGTLKHPGNNILAYHRMCSLSDLPATKAAWQQVLEAESIFRTEFRIEDGEGYLVDTGVTPYRWRETQVPNREEFDAAIGKRPSFDDVGFEFQIITTAGDNSLACILWHVHHVFIDGLSMQLILDKVSRIVAGHSLEDGPSFVAFAWERNLLIKELEVEAKQYWASQRGILDAAACEIRLPRSHVVAGTREFWNNVATFTSSASQTKLADYALRHHVTVSSIYYAAWALVLSIVCDSNAVLLGVVMSGRSLSMSDILEVVGSLVNTLPMGVEIEEDATTVEFINKVFRQLIELSSFDWSPPEHGYRRQFSSILAMQFDVGGHTARLNTPSSRMNSEIQLSITVETEGTIHIQFSHEYQQTHINLLGTYFTRAIESLLRPNYTVSTCLEDILSLSDRQTLLTYGNCLSGLTTETGVHDDLVVLMKAAAVRNPDFCAAQQGAQSMSYRELDRWSSCVAAHLSMYISQGDVVCVHANPCTYWLIAIYGILKAGGVYCPLNSKLDRELRNGIFKSSEATVYLTPSASETRYRPKSCRYAWAVEDLLQRSDGNSNDEFEHILCPEANAYLCFTSGSTGKPKGVLCTHRGLVASQKDLEVRLQAEPGRRIAQIMSVSFDGSIHEIFSTLSYGATLVLPDTSDPFSHLCDVDSCMFTPSLAATLDPSDYPNLRYVYLVGEQVPQDVNDRWAAKVALYNMYGPTEVTCGVTIKRLLPRRKITIGRPIPSARIYILNRKGHLAPPGAMGQIYLAGVQVSNGYIGQQDLTNERFFPDSVCRGLGERQYATGDIGYWNEDGELVHLGRDDRQTKLRGFRLDLDDLEVRIAKLPGITKAAVARHEDDLVVLIQPATASPVDCRKHMRTVLPEHAIPRYIIPVAQFPMTPVGKLDYKAAIAQALSTRRAPTPTIEMSVTERRVADIWADILAVDKAEISPESTFIAVGGHSLLQLRLAGRLSKEFDCSVPLTAIFEAFTLRDLCQKIDEPRERQCRVVLSPSAKLEEGAISRVEAEWISKYNCSISTASFTVSFACRLDSSVDLDRLKKSWNFVLASHKILRSRYITCARRHERVYSARPPVAHQVDYCNVLEIINRPFNIADDNLIRVIISPDTLLVAVSHILCDLTTMQLLLNYVQRVYRDSPAPSSSPLYMGADAWHRAAADSDLAFWSSYLKDSPHSKAKRETYQGTSQVNTIPRETALALDDFIKNSQFSHHQLGLAAVSLALEAQSDDPVDTVIGGPFLNRWSEADMKTVGLFLEPLPFRIQFDPTAMPKPDADAFLRSVKCSSQAAISHAVPWEELLRHLDVTPQFPNHPLFETMVTFHNTGDGLRLDIEGVEPLYTWSGGAKFGLMCEFTGLAHGETLLRLEYDQALYSTGDICRIEKRIITALDLLVRNTPYADMLSHLREVDMESVVSVGSENHGSWFLSPLRRT